MRVMRKPAQLPKTVPALPRMSSSESGFFFCGMSELPVLAAMCKWGQRGRKGGFRLGKWKWGREGRREREEGRRTKPGDRVREQRKKKKDNVAVPVGVRHADKAKLLAVVVAEVLGPLAKVQHNHGRVKEELGDKVAAGRGVEGVAADALKVEVCRHGVAVDGKGVARQSTAAYGGEENEGKAVSTTPGREQSGGRGRGGRHAGHGPRGIMLTRL